MSVSSHNFKRQVDDLRICEVCGYRIKLKSLENVFVTACPGKGNPQILPGVEREVCIHLGNHTGEDTLLIRRSPRCRGNTRTSVWECEVFGLCTPYGTAADEKIHPCRRCSHRKTDFSISENDPPPSQNFDDLTDAEKRASIQTEFTGVDRQRHKK